MRLFKAKTLKEYYTQLEYDAQVLKRFYELYSVHGELSGDDYSLSTNDRDTWENHSYIIGEHKDMLRQLRNEKRKLGKLNEK